MPREGQVRVTVDVDQLAWDETRVGSEDLLVTHVAGSTVLSLNEAGALLFRRLVDGETPDELAAALSDRYGIELDRAKEDVASFLDGLQARGLLRHVE